MGAAGMTDLCAGLETAGAAGDVSQASDLLDHLCKEFERVRTALEAEGSKSPDRDA